ncbi:MAG: Gfo/Idh/MocA family oxidoreductase [Armatimonadota bacterium]|nr:Gfo/Idh/MocA family oxidoreductase [Armatimonadota bacterium]MDR7451971.1 Gfo/Idh/MocA family oxidoreductase [Armatimonadota bacterium]MDR7468364.1 Gfo/Idh/MocA family oxidoreductase [Armatimonadota bacterium]MDR7494285.1 Gfo/Idh/MocA family oxidoreductase [Armatimonadota bacterium]MDR7500551.1 Gfo/Idh/MocA family oxidoreductase [Armatimonadota bacterium]
MSVRVGVLGAGFIGRVHALNLKKDERVTLVGVADVVPAAAARLAAEVETRPLDSLEALLDAGAKAVYVATPNTMHVEPVLRCLAAGVHVFSEKPMATSLEGAWRIREAARTSRAVYQIGFNRRFSNVYAFARRLIADGRITPYAAQMKHNRGELKQPPWTGDPRITGGYLYETPVHLFDMGRFLFGEVAEIQGYARQSVYEELDGFVMLLRFRNGVVASLTSVAHTSWLFPYERVEIYGAHQTVVTEELERAWFSPGMREPVEALDCFQMPFEQKWGYVTEDRVFIDAVLGARPPAVTAEDGYRATELVEACYRAAREGRPVTLPLPEPTPT